MGRTVKRSLAKWLWAGVPVVWDADDGAPETEAVTPQVTVVHVVQALPLQRDAITGNKEG
jgi:hypothetical protein